MQAHPTISSERTIEAVHIPAGRVVLEGDLRIPKQAVGLVVFVHGSGSSRFSPRNLFVAKTLNEGGVATLLLDLLTKEEAAIDAETHHLRFDIGLLADRLVSVIEWIGSRRDLANMRIGLFGASTGAAAALVAAGDRGAGISAVVSRGGRPDLAIEELPRVTAPTLLIVGGRDQLVKEMNEQVLGYLRGTKALKVIPGATHLFEEPGALEEVARLANEWFTRHLGRS